MSAMGQDLDSTIALFTAANEVLQDPASTGTALRSMSLRMRGFDEETEELSEDLIGITGDIIDLTKTAEHAQGVSIFTDATQTKYKDFVDYFRELSEVWDEMSAKNQTALLNNLFGKRGAQAGSALIKNFATVDAALQKMQNSAGNAEKEMSVITQSLSYKLNALKETGTGIAQNLFARKDIGVVVDGLTALLNVIDKLTAKLGLFGTIGAAGGLFAFIKNLESLKNLGQLSGAVKILNNLQKFGTAGTKAMYFDGMKAALAGMTAEAIGATAATMGLTAAETAQIVVSAGFGTSEAAKAMALAGFTREEATAALITAGYSDAMVKATVNNMEFTGATVGATGATTAFATSLKNVATGMLTFLTTNPMGWALMVVAAMGIAMAAVANATKTFDDLKETAETSLSDYKSTQGEVDSLNQKLAENRNTINELRAKGTLTFVEEAQLNMLTQTNAQLERQLALKQKVADSQQKQAASDASTALTSKTRMVTNNTGTAKNPVYTTESVDIIDETLNLQDKYIAKQEKINELQEKQAEYDVGTKEYNKIGKQIEQAERDSKDLHNQITNNLSDISALREGLVDSTTGEAVKGYEKDLKRIDKLTYDLMSDTEKAAYRQSQIDNLLATSKYKNVAKDMLEFAKAQGEAGITGDQIKENFSDIAKAAEDAGIDVDDLARTVNAMTGSINVKEVTKQLNEMKDALKDDDLKSYLGNLFDNASDEELKLYYSIMQSNDTSGWSIEDWQDAIERFNSLKVSIGFDISGEKDKLENLRSILSESRSDTGLSQDSISTIRSTYGELEGFDESKVFYNTANGVRANTAALKDLQRQYVNLKKNELNDQLNENIKNYNKAEEAIKNLKKGTAEYKEASDKADFYKSEMENTQQLISQYNALTSAYNEWIAAQNAGTQRSMYQNAASGYEATGSLIKQGWVNDDSVQAYMDLVTYGDQASFTAEEVKNRYEELGKTIEGTSYSVKDFFMKIDEEGNAAVDETTGGINNFVSALKELGKVGDEGVLDASKADEYAQALGVDISLVETMIRAAEEAGYKVNNTWASTTATITEVNSALEEAKQELEQFRNEDGTININAEGAEEAQQKVTELLAKKQELEQANGVMSINLDTSGFDEGVTNALSKLQELQAAINEYETAKVAGLDTSEAEAKISGLAQEINGLDPEIKAKVGLEEGSDLSSQIESLASDSEVEVGAKLADGASEAITSSLNGLNAEVIVTATTSGQESVDGLNTSIETVQDKDVSVTANVIGQSEVDKLNSSINALQSRTVTETALVYGAGEVSSLVSSINSLHDKTVTITTNYVQNGSPSGGGRFSGNAYASGTWGGAGGMTLLGELSKELVVDPKTGKWYTVGDNGAEFRNIPPGAIVFNHVQTEQLMKNGHINSRGHALAGGNAMASGSSDKLWDWIEIFISRLERGIKKLEKAVDNAYKTWSERGNSLSKEIAEVKKELDAQQKAYNLYMNKANSLGLSAAYQSRVKSGGLVAIESIADENLNDKISKFKEFYEKALDAKDAVEELKEKLAELYTTAFKNIEKNYDHQLKLVNHLTKTYDKGIDLLEAKGRLVGASYYKAMQDAEKKNNSLIQKELSSLITAYNNAMNSGYIKEGSEQWYEFNEQINETKEALQESNIQLAKLAQKVREVKWDNFDFLQDRITAINDEAEFLVKLLKIQKLKDDDGHLTDAGLATLGLHGQSYNTYMAQADDYANQIKEINKDIANDPNNTKLIKRREELYKLQRKMILAANEEKDAMLDLVKDGYKSQLDAMKKLIDEYKDSLDSSSDLFSYQKKIKKQTDSIASLRKQLAAYSGDTSEENRARIQKLQVDLSKAQEELAETEYDKYIKDQKKLLENFYTDYEENINNRMDNVDTSFAELIQAVNNNSIEIGTTLRDATQEVGYTMTDELRSVWDNSGTSNIISEYSSKFDEQLTTVNAVLASIDAKVASMIGTSEAEAASTISSASSTTKVTKPAAKKSTAKTNANTKSSGGIVTPNFTNGSDRLNVRDAPSMNGKVIRQLAKGNLVGTDWKESNGWLHIHVINSSEDYWGWASKQYLKAYANGAKHVSKGFAWTQEYGAEAILRPTENAILTKLNSGDSVLSANATSNIFDFGNDPLGFLARLGISNGILDSASMLGALATRAGRANVDVGGISINIPIEHVEDYNDLVNQIKGDKKFEKFIQSITVDRLVGGSALAKNNIKW